MSETEETRGEWIRIKEVGNLSEARIVLSLLQSEGIEGRLEYDPAGSVILGPGSVNPWSGVGIWVPERSAELAADVLESAGGGEASESPDA